MPFLVAPQDMKERIEIREIEDKLISEGKFDEAQKLAESSYYSKQITRTRYQNLITKEIPTAKNFGNDEVFTDNPIYEQTIGALEQVIATT